MKSILLAMAFIFSGLASAYTTGDKIHFQRDGVYVNSVHNKSLCLDRSGNYRATVTTCVKWEREQGDRNCVKWGKKTISQPMRSTRVRCSQRSGDECSTYTEVEYRQGRTRHVKYYNNNDDYQYTRKVNIPSC